MQRYLAHIVVGALAGLAALIGGAALLTGYPTSQSALIMRAKLEVAESIASPKILLVGGSNVRFGFSAEQIERETGVPAVNLALSADLGVDYLLYLTRSVAKPGDTVVLALEYNFYDSDELVTSANAAMALWRDVGWVSHLPAEQIVLWVRNIRLWHLGFALRSALKPPLFQLPVGVFGGRGDHVLNAPTPETVKMIARLEREPAFNFVVKRNRIVTRSIAEFGDWAKSHGVTVIAAWPTLYRKQVDWNTFPAFERDVRAFYQEIGATVIGSPEDGMLAADKLFDSAWHANADGTRARTTRLIEQLRARRLLRM
jgi:hypothetical protein